MALCGCSKQDGNEQILSPTEPIRAEEGQESPLHAVHWQPVRCSPANLVRHRAEPNPWCWDLAFSNATAPKEKLTCSGAGISLFWTATKFLQSGSCFKHLPVLWTLSWGHDLCCQSQECWEVQPQQDTQDCTHKHKPRILLQAQRKPLPFKSQELLLWKLLVQNYLSLSIIFERGNKKVLFFPQKLALTVA